ncbi:MAG: mechanosensitive ion channel family protein [Nitrososphaerota archaeon]|nr:mechanosensitive ion channel family protein [Nitrososphaerota archaeon]MDG7039359.1 mechanosensitive ion channel family protein [Nitrososphaerota archaeon]MDG7043044.1 mechanosensitive ion channel family protein [Nitrososphaerota archaeon]
MDENEKKYGRLLVYSVLFIVLIIGIGAGLYYVLFALRVVSITSSTIIKLVVAAALGIVAITFLGREIGSVSTKILGKKHGNTVVVIYRFVAYITLALILLAIVGMNGTELLAGGTFAGLVLGLAGQTVLSNIMAGIMIILVRPYEVSDRVTFTEWQFGMIAPVYPPKFYSHEYIIPGYSGTVKDIGLTYTTIQLDDSPLMKIPNSLMIQAAIVSHDLKERWVRTKYEIPAALDPDRVLAAVSEVVRKNEWVTQPESVRVTINAATSSIYVIAVDAMCKGNYEEPPRSSLLLDIMKAVRDIQKEGR